MIWGMLAIGNMKPDNKMDGIMRKKLDMEACC